jgi:hypothetical protein
MNVNERFRKSFKPENNDIEYCHLTDKYSVNNNPLDLKQQPVNTFIYRLHKCTTILIEVLIIVRENTKNKSKTDPWGCARQG